MHKTHIKLASANAEMHLELPCSHEDVEIRSSSQFHRILFLAFYQIFNLKAQDLEVAVTQRADAVALHLHGKAETSWVTPSGC